MLPWAPGRAWLSGLAERGYQESLAPLTMSLEAPEIPPMSQPPIRLCQPPSAWVTSVQGCFCVGGRPCRIQALTQHSSIPSAGTFVVLGNPTFSSSSAIGSSFFFHYDSTKFFLLLSFPFFNSPITPAAKSLRFSFTNFMMFPPPRLLPLCSAQS